MKRHAYVPALLLALAAMPVWAAGKPSFDCARARTDVEKAICADGALAAQDASIAKLYTRARKSLDSAAAKALTEDQRYFVQVRDEAYANPFGSGTPPEELADRMKYRDAFLASLSFKRRNGFEGEWENLAGGFSVKKQADGRLLFDGSAAHPQNGRWVCDVSGIGTVKGNTLVVEDPQAEGWTLTLTRKGAAVNIAENPPAGGKSGMGPPYCGHNGSLGGMYFPVAKP
ncbi:lysozyme inhibitor LprI family protein [Achromobacter deleyi]|uniref:lysozyme inhibitor LprI family protein n=1 Tax=Achromobacter deleyi TaxID=1353891 RepID=UPI001492A026|nr:lysozyme inhibitor LprI family protein [Achromobacter deleyi]QVQ26849.1 DUF1311 domain-containing protein [Achromobacter deleyi]UIP22425.1 lysozyme inhibitor LprI family protein [Achromobacter deleyi]